jgi:ubiquitin carboxyl-terminal hydrolase 9/24
VARLLAYLATSGSTLANLPALLAQEVEVLARARSAMLTHGQPGISETLLEGHLALTRELVMFLPPDKKQEIGCGGGGGGLVRELVQAGLRSRIHFIRIRIQLFRLNTDPDPDPGL